MATITKRGTGWFVQVRRKGYEPRYKTLSSRAEAEAWARQEEAAIDRGKPASNPRCLKATTLGDILRRYAAEVTVRKRSADSERLRIGKLLTAPVCALSLADLTPTPLAAYRDARLVKAKPATVRRELSIIRSALNIARREWDLPLGGNPVDKITLPRAHDARDRRLAPGDIERIEAALRETRNPLIGPFILFSIETALRRGETLKLEWRYVNLERRIAHIPETKNGRSRTIPLTDAAVAILRALPQDDARVFPMSAVALRQAWDRLRVRAGITDLRIHDIRHEAISRFAEMGLTTVELSVISGHRDPRMLFRYAHLRPDDLALKLAGRSWASERPSSPS